jgi:hypothetical protein
VSSVPGLIRDQHSLAECAIDAAVDDLIRVYTEPEVLQHTLQRLLVDAFIS